MAVLAVECSTRAAKALVHSLEKGVLFCLEVPYGTQVSAVDTLDRPGVMACMRLAMAKATSQAKDAGIPIHAVGLSSIWHSMELLDDHGTGLAPMFTWANTQAAPTAAKARENKNLHWLYKHTGCVIHSMYPLWQYLHLLQENPAMAQKASSISSLAQAMTENLTGERIISRNIASGSGFMALDGQWDADILAMARLHANQMPSLGEMDTCLPLSREAAIATGLPQGLPVALGGADGGLNQVGAGAVPGRMTFSVGTSGALRMACQTPYLPASRSHWCYWLQKGTYIAGAATSGAGNCVTWFRETLLNNQWSFDALEQGLIQTDRLHAPTFLPFLYGERSPGWQDTRTGGFVGITARHTPADLYYALWEGILFNLYDAYLPLLQDLGEPKTLLLSGGITHSKACLALAADIFGRPLEYTPSEHTSCIGAAAAAHAAIGALPSPLAFMPPKGQLCHPGTNRSILQERWERYRLGYTFPY